MTLAEFCVQILLLFYEQDHLVLSNSFDRQLLLFTYTNSCSLIKIQYNCHGVNKEEKRLLFNSDPWPPAEQKLEMPCDISGAQYGTRGSKSESGAPNQITTSYLPFVHSANDTKTLRAVKSRALHALANQPITACCILCCTNHFELSSRCTCPPKSL